MVKSGLMPEKYFVGHIELTTHFVAALILLSYTLWFALTLMPSFQKKVYNSKLNKQLYLLLILFLLQIIFGGFMAGLKAASSAPTWPSINGSFAPNGINELSPWIQNIFQNKLMIHFIHRLIGYALFIFSVMFFIQSKKNKLLSILKIEISIYNFNNPSNYIRHFRFIKCHQYLCLYYSWSFASVYGHDACNLFDWVSFYC